MTAKRNEHNPTSNVLIAESMDETAQLLEAQGANPFRVQAYRRGAETIRQLPDPARTILASGGTQGLMELPGIGRSLAHVIEQLVVSGRSALLERLRGENVAERMFATVPNIGRELAKRIHEVLGIETLAELEVAAHDGRLVKIPGMGRKRLQAVRESLAGRFSRPGQPLQSHRKPDQSVAVEELLDVDAEYRRLVGQNKLPRIAPRRFNPTSEAWLPVLHTERTNRRYTALYSNTARAHELGTTHDWVVIYRDDDDNHGRWTAITAQYGPLRGRRIVRGRESDCAEHYGVAKHGKRH